MGGRRAEEKGKARIRNSLAWGGPHDRRSEKMIREEDDRSVGGPSACREGLAAAPRKGGCSAD